MAVVAALVMASAWVAVALFHVHIVPPTLTVARRMAAAMRTLRFSIFISLISCLDGRGTRAVRITVLVARKKGGFPRLAQAHLVSERFEGRDPNGGGGGQLLYDRVHPADMLPMQDEAGEFAAVTVDV